MPYVAFDPPCILRFTCLLAFLFVLVTIGRRPQSVLVKHSHKRLEDKKLSVAATNREKLPRDAFYVSDATGVIGEPTEAIDSVML